MCESAETMKENLKGKRIPKLSAFCLILPLIFCSNSYGQSFNNWFLAIDSIMSFNSKGPVLVKPSSNIIKSRGGWRSCISNCNGKVLLYSNVSYVYNQFGDSIGFYLLNGANYGAATNSFCPKPGNDSIFYHFYLIPKNNSNVAELRYAVINALANNGAGKIIQSKVLLEDTCDLTNLCILRNQSGNSFWIMVTANSTTAHCFKVDSSGVSSQPVISKNVYNFSIYEIWKYYPPPNTLNNSFVGNNSSRIVASNDGNKIVSNDIPGAISNYSGNAFIYDFDQITGKLSKGKSILPHSEVPLNYSSSAACFSGDDSLVYISINPSHNIPFGGTKTYKVIQYNIKKNTRKLIRSSNNGADAIASMSMGNDGRIYGFSQTSYDIYSGGTVSIIQYPNKAGIGCNIHKPVGFPRMNKILPSPTDYLINVHTNLEYTNCVDTVLFSVLGDSNFAVLTCHFGDGDSIVINKPQSKKYNFKHHYKSEGRFANLWEGRTKECNAPVWYSDTIDVKFAPSSVSKSITFNHTPSCTNSFIQYNDTVENAAVYRVNWGDDSIISYKVNSGILALQHTYSKAGNYNIMVTVSNAWACDQDYVYPIKIKFLSSPQININPNAEQCANRLLNLVNDSANDADTLLYTYNQTQNLVTGKNPIKILLQFGQDTVFLLARNTLGCIARDTFEIKVKPGINAAFSNSKNEYCLLETDTIKRLFSNPGDSSLWYWENSVYLFEKNFPLKATKTGKQTLVHMLFSIEGCRDTQFVDLDVRPLPKAEFTSLKAQYCTGEKLNLQTFGTTDYDTVQWYINGLFQKKGATILQALNDTGMMELMTIAISEYGCRDSMNQSAGVYQTPSAIFDISDTTLCMGDSLVLSAQKTADSSNWQLGNLFNTEKIWSLKFNEPVGRYVVNHISANTQGCRDTASKLIEVQNYPKANFTFTSACEGQKIDFTDKTSGKVIEHYWLIQNVGYQSVVVSDTFKTAGIYPVFLRVHSSFGCADSIIKQIRVFPTPRVSIYYIGSSYKESNQFKYFLESNPDTFIKYNWTLGSAGSSSNSSVFATFNTPGSEELIHLEVQDNRNCLGSTDTIIKVLGLTGYYFPNSFSPNNDRINDGFGIAGPEYIKTYKLRIYNRWGEHVFYTENPYQLWEPENPVPGEYIFKAVIQDIYSQWKEIEGFVILIR